MLLCSASVSVGDMTNPETIFNKSHFDSGSISALEMGNLRQYNSRSS